jgi:hypothetical protein
METGMKALKTLALALLLVGWTVAGVLAQQASPAADPARVAAARELFRAMGAEASFKTVIDTLTIGMAQIIKQQQPGKASEIDEVFQMLREKFYQRSNEVVDMVAPLWAEKFTAEELGEIARFFATPIGKRFVAAQPEITQRSMQLGMAWGQRIGAEVEAEARSELKKRGVDL